MYTLTQVSQSTTPVVSLDQIKAHLRIDDDNSDTYLEALVERATELIEIESNVDLRPTTWLWVGQFPRPIVQNAFYSPTYSWQFTDGLYQNFRYSITLPRAPLVSVEPLQYYDPTNTLQTYTQFYVMKGTRTLGWIQAQQYWPASSALRPDALQITFSSGYTTAPALAQHAILLACGTWYENREDENTARLSSMNVGFERLLAQLSIPGVY
jgi:uncharacterized phiE125 gp8 family phage protein